MKHVIQQINYAWGTTILGHSLVENCENDKISYSNTMDYYV